MKKFLASAALSLATGICFALGVALVLMAYAWLEDGTSPASEEFEFTKLPLNVGIVEHSRVQGRPSYTIRGVLENTGPSEWAKVSVQAEILAGGTQVNTCDTSIDNRLPSGSRRAFQIECYDVAGENLPENISYRLTVFSAQRKPG